MKQSLIPLFLAGCLVGSGCSEATDSEPVGVQSSPQEATGTDVVDTAAPPPQGTPDEPVPPTVHRVSSNGGRFEVELVTSPSPPPWNETFSIRLRILEDGKVLDPAPVETLTVDADMPAHQHGMNVTPSPALLEEGWVEYGPLLFHMPGPWEIYVDRHRSALTERAQVEFEVR